MKKTLLFALGSALAVTLAVTSAVYAYAGEVPKEAAAPVTTAITTGLAEESATVPTEPAAPSKARALTAAPATDTITQDQLWHMMLNSIDYYNQVSGQLTMAAEDASHVTDITFQSDLLHTAAYAHILHTDAQPLVTRQTANIADDSQALATYDLEQSDMDRERFIDSDSALELNHRKETYQEEPGAAFSLATATEILDENRITDIDGAPCYNYRSDPTNVPEASICLFPQAMAFGFLSDQSLWQIDGTESYLNRTCYVVTGTTDAAYGEKLGVSSFTFLVDTQTGTLLQYAGYQGDGTLADFMYVTEIAFGADADAVNTPDTQQISSYTRLQ